MFPMAYAPYLPTAHDVLEYSNASGVLQVELNVEHMEAILDVLVWDGEIEKIWMRRFKEDGWDMNIKMEGVPDPSANGRPNGKGNGKKRKLKEQMNGNRKKKKLQRAASASSDDIDADSVEEPIGEEEEDDDDDDDDGDNDDNDYEEGEEKPDNDLLVEDTRENYAADNSISSQNVLEDTDWTNPLKLQANEDIRPAHLRPGPAGNDWYWVYRTCLTAIPTTSVNAEGMSVTSYPALYDLGILQTPCGICPVSEFCYNRGQPKLVPLPGEKELVDGGAAKPMDWRSSTRISGVDRKGKLKGKQREQNREKEQMAELLKMKVPAGGGELEDADGTWKGGGKVGGKVIAPVNPADCECSAATLVNQVSLQLIINEYAGVYYSQWFGEEIEW